MRSRSIVRFFVVRLILLGLFLAAVHNPTTVGPAVVPAQPAAAQVAETPVSDLSSEPVEDLRLERAEIASRSADVRRSAARTRANTGPSSAIAQVFADANPGEQEAADEAASAVLSNADDVFSTELLMSWLYEESRLSLVTVSHAGAVGVAQIMPETGRWVAEKMAGTAWEEARLAEPKYSIDLGAAYLRWLFRRYKGQGLSDVDALHKTFTAYLRGIGGVETYSAKHGRYASRYSSCVLSRVGLDDGTLCRTLSKSEEGE